MVLCVVSPGLRVVDIVDATTVASLVIKKDRNRGSKLELLTDKMRKISAMIGWLLPLYLVCVLCQSA